MINKIICFFIGHDFLIGYCKRCKEIYYPKDFYWTISDIIPFIIASIKDR